MRYFGWKKDTVAGGTGFDAFTDAPLNGAFPNPDVIVPVTSGQANPGDSALDRNNDVINQRGNSAPVSFAAAPTMTFESRAWTKLMRDVLRDVMAGTIATTGVAPAALQSTVQMAKSGQGDAIPCLCPTLIREGQVDQMVGAAVASAEFNFPAEGEGTVSASLKAKYHEVFDSGDAAVAGLPTPGGGHPAGYTDAYMLRDVVAMVGAAAVEIDCLGGFGFTIDNNMVDDIRVTHCAGHNIAETVVDTVTHRLWYPDRHRPGAQAITGRLDFGETRPDRELRRILSATEKLVVELSAGPLATTPPADEMIRLVFWNIGYTGGGAEPLAREGEQVSSYEFTAYVDDATGKDLEAIAIGTAALV